MTTPGRQKSGTKEVSGLLYPIGFSTEAVQSALTYKARDDDLFIATYPKSGTTWCQQIVSLILNRGQPFRSYDEFVMRSPFMEKLGVESGQQMPRPGVLKLHLPFSMLSYNPRAKYLYVVRNPKDVIVSYYHHAVSSPIFDFSKGDFDTYFEEFLNGEVAYGDYFQHVLEWYKHRNDPGIYFMVYEEMKRDIQGAVLEIADFMGQEWLDLLQKDKAVLDSVLMYSSLEEMRKLCNKEVSDPEVEAILRTYPGYVYTKEYNLKHYTGTKLNLIRNGNVGDWKEVLTSEQNRKINLKIEKNLTGTTFYDSWKNINCI